MTKRPGTYLLIAFSFLSNLFLFSQETEYDAVFHPPLNIPLYLSGSFGELRSNHFHAGIDIKTQGVEGKEVLAIEDGYISRIKVSTGGYGKALYITHPNGYVSVYGHLKRYNKTIEGFVKKLQYSKERYSVEAFPEKGLLDIKKGEVIAFSGNTGGSSGPHLHFEIREEATQYPVNPLFFDSIRIKDQISPRIEELAIYPVNSQTLINGKNDTAYFRVEKRGRQYVLTTKKKITVSGSFSLGLQTYDLMNDVSNKNGIYSVELNLDKEAVFGLEMDKLSFSTVRYINSLIDYHHYKDVKRRLIRTQVDTNNRLFNYRNVSNNGIFSFSDTLIHSFTYKVKDAYNNGSIFTFKIEGRTSPSGTSTNESSIEEGVFFDFSKENHISRDEISLDFPANAFYRSYYFKLNTLPAATNTFAHVFEVHNKYTPVQKHFSLSILPDTIPEQLKNKMYIGVIDDEDQHYFIGDKWEGDRLTTKTRLLGKYSIFSDSINPEIKAVNFYNLKNVSAQNTLKVKISDKQTGISTYRAELNGQWILMEYDPKKSIITYTYDEYILNGENKFKLVVKDLLDNETKFTATITK